MQKKKREKFKQKKEKTMFIGYDELAIVDVLLYVLQVFVIDKNLYHNRDI